MNHADLRLYGLIDPQIARGRSLAELTRAAVHGGATLIQYRDKDADTRTMIERARAIRDVLTGTGVPLLINDRIDVALAAGADGAHIGQSDMHATDARALLGPNAIIGLTINTGAHALEAQKLPIDHVGIGNVFPTGSKDVTTPPLGPDGLTRLITACRESRPHLPVVAIAGITADNAASVIAVGADGIAVISSLFGPDDVTAAARVLRQVVDDALNARRA